MIQANSNFFSRIFRVFKNTVSKYVGPIQHICTSKGLNYNFLLYFTHNAFNQSNFDQVNSAAFMCYFKQEEFKNALLTNTWHRRLEFTGGETIVMHNPNVILHFLPSSQPDEWGTAQVSHPNFLMLTGCLLMSREENGSLALQSRFPPFHVCVTLQDVSEHGCRLPWFPFPMFWQPVYQSRQWPILSPVACETHPSLSGII